MRGSARASGEGSARLYRAGEPAMLDACGAGHGDGATAALAALVAGRRGLGLGWAKTITLRPRGIVIGFPFLIYFTVLSLLLFCIILRY